MKTIVVTNRMKVNIDDNQLRELCIDTLRNFYSIPKGAYVSGENLVEWHNTHGSGTTEVIRKLTKKDTIILGIIEELDS